MYADYISPSAQPFPPASQPQHDLSSPSVDEIAESVPESLLLPSPLTFTVSPGHPDDKILRAPTQSTIYSTAKPKAQHAKAAVRETVQRIEDVTTLEASDRAEVQITSQEQDLNAAGILVEAAREQHPILPTLEPANSPVIANASLRYTRKCPVPSCPYHLDRGFWSKTEKNNHIMTHFEGQIGFATNDIRCSLPWPSFIEDPENFFPKIEILKRRVGKHFIWYRYGGGFEDSTCHICLRSLDTFSYVEHLDDCIVHAVQAQALGTARPCSVLSCEHDPPRFRWGSGRNEPMVKHFVPSLGCGRCYTNQCQCPPIQQDKVKSSVDGFIRLWTELERDD